MMPALLVPGIIARIWEHPIINISLLLRLDIVVKFPFLVSAKYNRIAKNIVA